MIASLASDRRVALRLLLVLLATATVAGLGSAYVATLHDQRERITEQRRLLGRLTVHEREADRLALAGSVAGPARSELFISGPTEAVRQSTLQLEVGKLLRAAGLTVRSARPLAPIERDGLQVLGSDLQLTGTLSQVQSALVSLEAARPILLIQSVQIGLMAGADIDAPPRLEARLVVNALAERPAAVR